MRRLIIASLFTLQLITLHAQKGIVKGKITDEKTGEALIGATVILVGTTQGAASDLEGQYTIPEVEPGTYSLKYQCLSYQSKVIPDVVIKASDETNLYIALATDEVAIHEVKVVAQVNREMESMLLLSQKNSLTIQDAIGAQQLSSLGIGDAASAVTRITGIARQEGSKTLNVRGLGDRYNSTTFNGLPLPSNHAEFKNIDLSLFPSDIIGYVGIEKVFTCSLYGDVAGANIDVSSKKFNGKKSLQVSLSSNYNLNLLKTNHFYMQDGPGFWGMTRIKNPESIENYSFKHSWNPIDKQEYPDINMSLSGGHSIQLGVGKLGFFTYASFNNEYSYNSYQERKVNGSDDNRMDLKGDQYLYHTQTSVMLNLNYQAGQNTMYWNSLYLNGSDQQLKNLNGYIIDVVGDISQESAILRRSDFERNVVWVNQLIGKHELSESVCFNWKVGMNHIDNILPDRRNNIFLKSINSAYTPSTNDAANHHRYFHDMNEDEFAINMDVAKEFGKPVLENKSYRGRIIAGYSLRYKERIFKAWQYNHGIDKNHIEPIDPQNVDAYFNNDRLQQGYFTLKTFFGNLNIPSVYTGNQVLNAGFISLEYDFTPRLSGLIGCRLETIQQEVTYETTLKEGKNTFDELNPFPCLSLRYSVNDKQNIRFASSVGYTLPQFKETAPFLFEGITDATVGNPHLYPSTIYNAEIKWEIFPSANEIASAAFYGKYIQDPINKFVMASASNDYSYANTGEYAYAYGIEMEARKQLYKQGNESSGQKWMVGVNLSLMDTYQELDKHKVRKDSKGTIIASFDKSHEKLEGAAPLLINANLSWSRTWKESKNGLSASLIYGYTSERLFLIGYSSLGNQYDKGFHDLNLELKSKFNQLTLSFSAKNLLNPDFVRIQKNEYMTHEVRRYAKGIKLGIGLSYHF